jgi:hypothetical protein
VVRRAQDKAQHFKQHHMDHNRHSLRSKALEALGR